MKGTFVSFGLFFLFTFCRLCLIIAKKYSANNVHNGYNCNVDDVAFEKDNVTKLGCASLCDGSDACLSVFFEQASLQCVGCKVWYNANEVYRTLSGSLHYEKQVCPNDTVLKRGRTCYFVSPEQGLTFDEARTFCTQRGGHLVQAETSDENKFLKTYFLHNVTVTRMWLGLTDLRAEGIWEWNSSGYPLEFEDWHDYELDGGTNQNCGVFHKRNGQWADVGCTFSADTLCEKGIEQ